MFRRLSLYTGQLMTSPNTRSTISRINRYTKACALEYHVLWVGYPPSAPLTIPILPFYRSIFHLYDLGANTSVFANSPLLIRPPAKPFLNRSLQSNKVYP
jgi:hypothetical protein